MFRAPEGRARVPRAYERRQSEPVTRQSLLRLGLYWGTLFVIVVGSCTLTFWFLASSTGLFNIAAPELFVIRSLGIVGLLLGAAGLFFIVGALTARHLAHSRDGRWGSPHRRGQLRLANSRRWSPRASRFGALVQSNGGAAETKR